MLDATLNRRPASRSARMVIVSILLSVTLSIAAVRGSAQTISMFSGSVFDQTGAGVPTVTLVLSRASSEPAVRPASSKPLDPIVKDVVLEGIRQWQWEPTRLNGILVEVPFNVTIDFVPSR